MRRVRPLLSIGLALTVLGGCAGFHRAAPAPMAMLADARNQGQARCLLVLLPGINDRASIFGKEEIVDLVRARSLSVDIISADATFGYYSRRTLIDRLAVDIMEPARTAGYQHTWMAGISLGGFGSLLYAQQRPADVDGVLALSPYLGDRAVTADIERAGGLVRWTAPPPDARDSGDARQLWRWLQDVAVHGKPGPALYVGWGDADRFRREDALLGAALPADHVFRAPGKHDWDTWRRLLSQWLDRSTFATECAVSRP